MDLKEKWIHESKKGIEGWDFSYLDGRMEEEPLPWDYEGIIRTHLQPHHELLDMGTGGGEFLLTLGHPYEKTSVTEGYRPNFKLCVEKLTPLGIKVKFVTEDDRLTFADASFDIVLNRHESFDPKEVYRVLKPGGLFITQQVGGADNREMAEFLIENVSESPYMSHTLENNIGLIESAGLEILESDECFSEVKFHDVGALVYFASIIDWEFPGFSVEKSFERLVDLENIVKETGFISSKQHRFIIVAKK